MSVSLDFKKDYNKKHLISYLYSSFSEKLTAFNSITLIFQIRKILFLNYFLDLFLCFKKSQDQLQNTRVIELKLGTCISKLQLEYFLVLVKEVIFYCIFLRQLGFFCCHCQGYFHTYVSPVITYLF